MNLNKSKIFITNLGRYNEGEFIGKWLELPINENEFKEELKNIGVDGVQYEEFFISDWENLPEVMSEYTTDIDTLNEYAELQEAINQRIDNLNYNNQYSEKQIEFIRNTFSNIEMFENHNNDIDDIINTIENAYIFISDNYNAYDDYGLYYLENDDNYINMPTYLKDFIDIEKYGREMYLKTNSVSDGNYYENLPTTVIIEFID